MATEILNNTRPTFTNEQREAWNKAKLLLASLRHDNVIRYRALHIAMSELRARYRKHKGPIETPAKNPDKANAREYLDKLYQLRKRVDAWKAYFENPGNKKLYVLCDATLSEAQKAVQSAHAVADFQKEYPFAPWTNGTLVLLQHNANRYSYTTTTFAETIKHNFNKYSWNYQIDWREPDLDNAITAVAFLDDYMTLDLTDTRVKML
jgi:hypothetical protein